MTGTLYFVRKKNIRSFRQQRRRHSVAEILIGLHDTPCIFQVRCCRFVAIQTQRVLQSACIEKRARLCCCLGGGSFGVVGLGILM
jgi:hypothetical protein